jgi:hypothetical protein
MQEAGDRAVAEMLKIDGKIYRTGSSTDVLYVNSGTSQDWACDAGVQMSYTFELRDEGEYGFLLPREQILPTAKEYTAGVKSLMEFTLDNFEGKSAGGRNGIVGLLVVILCLIG